jgi:hypothetical protein
MKLMKLYLFYFIFIGYKKDNNRNIFYIDFIDKFNGYF